MYRDSQIKSTELAERSLQILPSIINSMYHNCTPYFVRRIFLTSRNNVYIIILLYFTCWSKNKINCLFAVVSQFQKWRIQQLRSRPGKDNTVLKKHFSVYLTLYKCKKQNLNPHLLSPYICHKTKTENFLIKVHH